MNDDKKKKNSNFTDICNEPRIGPGHLDLNKNDIITNNELIMKIKIFSGCLETAPIIEKLFNEWSTDNEIISLTQTVYQKENLGLLRDFIVISVLYK